MPNKMLRYFPLTPELQRMGRFVFYFIIFFKLDNVKKLLNDNVTRSIHFVYGVIDSNKKDDLTLNWKNANRKHDSSS